MHFLRTSVLMLAIALSTATMANTGAIPVVGKGHTAAVVHNGEMYVFYKAASSLCQVAYVKTSDGVNWSAEQFIPLNYHCIGDGPHSAVSFNNRIYVSVDDSNNPGYMWYTSARQQRHVGRAEAPRDGRRPDRPRGLQQSALLLLA